MKKFQIGDPVKMKPGHAGANGKICKYDLVGRVFTYTSNGTTCVVEFDYSDVSRFDNLSSYDNIFGLWDCEVFDNNRGRRIPEDWLELAYVLPVVKPNVDFISELLGK